MIYLCAIIDKQMVDVSQIKRLEVDSYIDTLRDIEQGEIKKYRLVGTVYTGFHNAKTRLFRKGLEFEFKRFQDSGEHYLEIKRIK